MQSEYKLLIVKDKWCHFSCVAIEATIEKSQIKVAEEIKEPMDSGKGEVNRKYYPDWIDAALEGAQLCAQTLVQQRRISGCQITLIRVMGTDCDTIAEDVFCAAALATWQALLPDTAVPTIDFTDGKWRIQFD